jgi:hypothetical protein
MIATAATRPIPIVFYTGAIRQCGRVSVADRVGAPLTDIHLEKDASETTVKLSPLADHRIVYFATTASLPVILRD